MIIPMCDFNTNTNMYTVMFKRGFNMKYVDRPQEKLRSVYDGKLFSMVILFVRGKHPHLDLPMY